MIQRSLQLHTGEELVWTKPTLLSHDGRGTVGGTLFVTTSGLVFVPNRLNLIGRKEVITMPLAEIERVGVFDRTYTLYDGGLRKRIAVTMKSGDLHLFLGGGEETAKELRSKLVLATHMAQGRGHDSSGEGSTFPATV